jgi:predicted transglutaminase-like cysteine proteinase
VRPVTAALILGLMLGAAPPTEEVLLREYHDLYRVNERVNKAITYTRDPVQYGVPDKWVENPASGKGDCDDYALTKMRALYDAGWERYDVRIVTLYVDSKTMKGGHAVTEVRARDGSTWILDNAHPRPMRRAELTRLGYRWDWP